MCILPAAAVSEDRCSGEKRCVCFSLQLWPGGGRYEEERLMKIAKIFIFFSEGQSRAVNSSLDGSIQEDFLSSKLVPFE